MIDKKLFGNVIYSISNVKKNHQQVSSEFGNTVSNMLKYLVELA